MLKLSPQKAKQNLKLQLLKIKYQLDDEDVLEALSHVEFGDYDDCCFVYEAVYIAFDRMFTFDYGEPAPLSPEMEESREEQVEYTVLATFHIPGLEKYIHEPAFEEFIDKIQFIEYGSYNDALELYYLPTCIHSVSDEEFEREYAEQPATFSIGVFDQGGCDEKQLINFLNKMKDFNRYINELIA